MHFIILVIMAPIGASIAMSGFLTDFSSLEDNTISVFSVLTYVIVLISSIALYINEKLQQRNEENEEQEKQEEFKTLREEEYQRLKEAKRLRLEEDNKQIA